MSASYDGGPVAALRLEPPQPVFQIDAVSPKPLLSQKHGQKAGFIGMAVLATLGLRMINARPFDSAPSAFQLLLLLSAARLMWSVVQWMGRYYILTDLRVIRVSGVFTVDVQSYPLRRVESVKLYRNICERLLNKGTLEITGSEGAPIGWQTISRPKRVQERVQAAVARAKHNGCGTAG